MECPYCIEQIDDTLDTCNFCGESVKKNEPRVINNNQPIKQYPHTNKLIAGVIFLFIIIGMISNNSSDVKMNTQEDIYASVVKIIYKDSISELSYRGSGLIFSKDGLVLTNNHIIENPNFGTAKGDITICIQKELTEEPDCNYTGTLIIRNVKKDLAVIQIKNYVTENYLDLFGETRIDNGSKKSFQKNNLDGTFFGKEINVYGYPSLGGEN